LEVVESVSVLIAGFVEATADFFEVEDLDFTDAVDFELEEVFLVEAVVLDFEEPEDFEATFFFEEAEPDFVEAVFFDEADDLETFELPLFFSTADFLSDDLDEVDDFAKAASLRRKHARKAKMENRSDWARVITKAQRLAAGSRASKIISMSV
jgi:hypothetical protein